MAAAVPGQLGEQAHRELCFAHSGGAPDLYVPVLGVAVVSGWDASAPLRQSSRPTRAAVAGTSLPGRCREAAERSSATGSARSRARLPPRCYGIPCSAAVRLAGPLSPLGIGRRAGSRLAAAESGPPVSLGWLRAFSVGLRFGTSPDAGALQRRLLCLDCAQFCQAHRGGGGEKLLSELDAAQDNGDDVAGDVFPVDLVVGTDPGPEDQPDALPIPACPCRGGTLQVLGVRQRRA